MLHEHDVVLNDVLLVNDFSAGGNFQLEFGGVVQLHDVAFGCVEDGIQVVSLIQVALAKPRLLLLNGNVNQLLFGFTGERTFQRIGAAGFKGLRNAGPGEAVIAQDGLLRKTFHLPRTRFF